jgi:IclR family pca regulon transcriptional regulator
VKTGEKSNDVDARYGVNSLELGLRLLELFNEDTNEITLSEAARRIGVSRSSAFRLMHTLERLGYLDRDEDTKSYRLGARVLNLGFSFLTSKDIAELAQPELQRLRKATHCSTHLAILDNSEIIYVCRFASHQPFSGTVSVGSRLPAHATTMGRAMLAFKPVAYVQEHFDSAGLRRYSEHTPGSIFELRAALDADRALGYVISHSGFEHGIASVAAPIFDASGSVIAAINATMPEGDVKAAHFDTKIRDAVIAAAAKISRLSGYRERKTKPATPERNAV